MEKKAKEEQKKAKGYDQKDLKIKELEEKNKDLVDSLQHLQAEFENYKKRACKDNESFSRFASAKLIEKMLPILDSFEFALKGSSDQEQFRKGIEMIFAQLFSTLESEGLRPINCIGNRFDPYRHEVMLKEPSDKDEDIIIEEMQKGYMLNERILRHSKVKTSTGKKKEEKDK